MWAKKRQNRIRYGNNIESIELSAQFNQVTEPIYQEDNNLNEITVSSTKKPVYNLRSSSKNL